MEKVFFIGAMVCVLGIMTACKNDVAQTYGNDNQDRASLYIQDNLENYESSMVPWIPDKVRQTKAEMVMLLDPLWAYTTTDNIEDDIHFMDSIRISIASYYDSVGIWQHSADNYAKADSVIDYFIKELNEDETTMGMIIQIDTKYRLERVLHYGMLCKMKDIDSSTHWNQLKNEFVVWRKVEDIFSNITASISEWSCCGGSLSSIYRVNSYCEIARRHLELYERDYGLYEWDDIDINSGVFQKSAKQLLISCCKEAYGSLYNDDNYRRNWGIEHGYASQVKDLIPLLASSVDEWILVRNMYTESICSDGNRALFHMSTSQMLVEWANMVTFVVF